MKAGLKEQAPEFTLGRTLTFPDFFDFKQKQEACWVCNRKMRFYPIVPERSQTQEPKTDKLDGFGRGGWRQTGREGEEMWGSGSPEYDKHFLF